jgi:hypothetical protein
MCAQRSAPSKHNVMQLLKSPRIMLRLGSVFIVGSSWQFVLMVCGGVERVEETNGYRWRKRRSWSQVLKWFEKIQVSLGFHQILFKGDACDLSNRQMSMPFLVAFDIHRRRLQVSSNIVSDSSQNFQSNFQILDWLSTSFIDSSIDFPISICLF